MQCPAGSYCCATLHDGVVKASWTNTASSAIFRCVIVVLQGQSHVHANGLWMHVWTAPCYGSVVAVLAKLHHS